MPAQHKNAWLSMTGLELVLYDSLAVEISIGLGHVWTYTSVSQYIQSRLSFQFRSANSQK